MNEVITNRNLSIGSANLSTENAEGRVASEGGGVPVSPLDSAGGHAHLPNSRDPAPKIDSSSKNGTQSTDHYDTLEQIRPHHGFESTLEKIERKRFGIPKLPWVTLI